MAVRHDPIPCNCEWCWLIILCSLLNCNNLGKKNKDKIELVLTLIKFKDRSGGKVRWLIWLQLWQCSIFILGCTVYCCIAKVENINLALYIYYRLVEDGKTLEMIDYITLILSSTQLFWKMFFPIEQSVNSDFFLAFHGQAWDLFFLELGRFLLALPLTLELGLVTPRP